MNTETTLKIFPCMCERQQQDLKQLLDAIDEFGANALALSSNSAHGYTSFIDSRDSVRKLLLDVAKNYRLVEA